MYNIISLCMSVKSLSDPLRSILAAAECGTKSRGWQRFGIRDRSLVPEINSPTKIEYDNYAERGLRSS